MKRVSILLILLVSGTRGIGNELNSTSDGSFQVNVSAGYGVHMGNSTASTPPPGIVFQIPERKVMEREDKISPPKPAPHVIKDQVMQPSDLIPSKPIYQVHEKNIDLQEKNYQVPKKHRLRAVEKRIRPVRKDLEKETPKAQINKTPTKMVPAGTKIVEVLRVPAVYELHLQSDPHRMVSLNPLVTKLNAMGTQKYQYKRHYYIPGGGTAKNFIPQSPMNIVRQHSPPSLGIIPNYSPPKPPKRFGISHSQPQQQVKAASFVAPTYKQYTIPKFNGYQYKKPSGPSLELPTTTTQATYQMSNEIPADYYQKPQALHEVPAPVLNRYPPKTAVPPTKAPAPVPGLVYGKTIEPPYHPPPTETPQVLLIPTNPSWSSNLMQDHYSKGHVDSVPNYYQQDEVTPEQQYYQQGYNLGHQLLYQAQQEANQKYQKQPEQNYAGNDAIADYLDQSLVNVNGGVSTYLNSDGTMTVANFHHNPQLYQAPIQAEPARGEDDILTNPGNFDVYQQPQTGYSPEIPVTEPNLEQDSGQDFNSLLESARASVEQQGIYDPKQPLKRMNLRRQFRSSGPNTSRRLEPVDYILFIKERTLD